MKKSYACVLRGAVLSALCIGTAYADGSVAISQVYGGGGNSGATLRNDYVELFNRSSASVSLSGWCLQYASSAGQFTLGNNQSTALAGAIPAGGYYLVQLGQGTGGTQNLPTPDAAGLTLMSASSGKLALLSSCATALDQSEPLTGGRVIDFVGFGTAASRFEGSGPTANLANTTAAIRANGGCQDNDNNQADFTVASPAPRNSLSPQQQCSSVNAPVVASCPTSVALPAGAGGTQAISARDLDGTVTNAAVTSTSNAGLALSSFTPAGGIGADANATLNFDSALPVGNHSITVAFSNSDATPQTGSCTIAVNVTPTSTSYRIHDIQGASHVSPLNNQQVTVPGLVTALGSNGFYMQDWLPDASEATSEGIFVFTNSAPTVSVGDQVSVSGRVFEFRPGGDDGVNNLTTTEITAPTVVIESRNRVLPAPVVLGAGGRRPPLRNIDDDATGSVETSGTFDAATDGIDFYESLEGMRVQVNNPIATGPTNSFGEISVLADSASTADSSTPRGGAFVSPGDFNPERIILDDVLADTPVVDTGAIGSVAVGVMDYSFGNFKLLVTTQPAFVNIGLAREVTSATLSPDQLTVASFNVENLSARDSAAKFGALAGQIVTNLRAPDIVAVMEIQDNNGATNDAVVEATQTFQTLIAAIASAGGPTYSYRQINPVDDQDGGEPGGNIRVGFLFNAQRVSFIDRPGGTSTSDTTILRSPSSATQLSASPGRIRPNDPAFGSSRKPLAGEFLFNGHKLFVIANHFNSKGGDQPLFGRFQPPQRSSEVQRQQQAGIVSSFARELHNSNQKVIVLGDLNDFQFSDTVSILKEAGLTDLVETLPENERYTYVFDGNSQALDHIMVSNSLAQSAEYDVVHVNSEFADQTSDHDPEVAKLLLPAQEVTSQLSIQRSGLVLNRATQLFTGTVKITNTGPRIEGQLRVLFEGLPAGVTLANASGTWRGVPYIQTTPPFVLTDATIELPVQFSNPSRAAISYTSRVHAGQF
jgi:predicted extracellular nuclease